MSDEQEVETTGRVPSIERLVVPTDPEVPTLTHRLFRYPAKFHPPVVDALLRRYVSDGDTVYDPFCGSGTLLVEASRLGLRSIGSDVDPLAVAVAMAKTRSYDIAAVEKVSIDLLPILARIERPAQEYQSRMHRDLNDDEYAAESNGLSIPGIPRIEHWFRRYVIIDLARIREAILRANCDEKTQALFMLVLGSIVRNSSNADPVPVSGLEVTSHMRNRDAKGRLVNPIALFRKALTATVGRVKESAPYFADSEPIAYVGDATADLPPEQVDAVITSPPYHNAVDYYRRHQLEMFWMGLTDSHEERLKLLPRYIGRPRIPRSHPMLKRNWEPSPTASDWEERIASTSATRALDFRAYLTAMDLVFARLHEALPAGAPAVFVVGRSDWNGDSIPTDRLFVEIAEGRFSLDEHLTYPVKNRYMSYARRNGASISEEHVLVLKRI